jgi:SAM-dependent methyltransferase
MNFKDHFSGHSSQYSAFRPSYPDSLFSFLALSCAEHKLAWDCATGSGQAAIGLIDHFDRVVATDASKNQVANAAARRGITYAVATAENSGLATNSADLITVAQGLHWFDIGAFASEANRVLKTGGVLAAWTYGLGTFGAGINEIVQRLYADIVGEYWPFERKFVESGYAEVEIPFEKLPASPMEMTAVWDFAALIGYLNTWSAVKAYERANGRNPLELVQDDLLREWGAVGRTRVATWPLFLKVWRKEH